MLDVHAPHQTVHTWKDFFIHIAAITNDRQLHRYYVALGILYASLAK